MVFIETFLVLLTAYFFLKKTGRLGICLHDRLRKMGLLGCAIASLTLHVSQLAHEEQFCSSFCVR